MYAEVGHEMHAGRGTVIPTFLYLKGRHIIALTDQKGELMCRLRDGMTSHLIFLFDDDIEAGELGAF